MSLQTNSFKLENNQAKSGPGVRYKGVRINPQLEVYEQEAFANVEAEYREDLLNSMKEMQTRTLPVASMIDIQPELEWFMRPYLLDFLVDTHLTLKLSSQTLFLAVNLVDRYCSKRVVAKKHYQLVGCTALWIASKYEDKKSHIPSISELISMCCGVYEEAMFLQMEGHILNTLEWSIGHTTLDAFIYLIAGSSCNPSIIHTARFLAESTMYHRAFFAFNPSLIANCCVVLASHILRYCSIPATFADPNELECINLLGHYMQSPTQSLQKKYMKSSCSQVPKIIASFIARHQAATITLPPSPAPSCDSDFDLLSVTTPLVDGTYLKDKKTASYMTPPHTPLSYNATVPELV